MLWEGEPWLDQLFGPTWMYPSSSDSSESERLRLPCARCRLIISQRSALNPAPPKTRSYVCVPKDTKGSNINVAAVMGTHGVLMAYACLLQSDKHLQDLGYLNARFNYTSKLKTQLVPDLKWIDVIDKNYLSFSIFPYPSLG